ncbi:MAG: Cobyrinic acid A,C-diamide synthase [Deltaproteobacteria bacterium]|nr:Cobyrinic acid A,C-diamide synthase [Deltaproteobacteria bacterium]
MSWTLPRLVMAALRGGGGKTTLSLGLAAAWRKQGREVVPFKKGPDYIDAAWLSLAAGRPCHNLDTFLQDREQVRFSFFRNALEGEVSLIEGNRGLYDGVDAAGTHSTAELAKLLNAPVVLILDCDKVTRTAAAMAFGCQQLDPEVDLRGVILNRVARSRQESVLRQAVESACGIPVVGAVPRLEAYPFPERHLGLTPPQEHQRVREALTRAQEVAEKFLDLESLEEIARKAPTLDWSLKMEENSLNRPSSPKAPVIGVIKDSAFQFYYPENLEALSNQGVKVIEISAVRERKLPEVDGLYIGGGFPETHAEALSENAGFRQSLREAVQRGLPIYAECGGLMYLGESLSMAEKNYPMTGVLPIGFGMEKRPQGHGYTLLQVEEENPFFPVGREIRGHEFHYSRVLYVRGGEAYFAFRVKRGEGIDRKRDGLCLKGCLATYSHLHALGCPEWAAAFAEKARTYRSVRVGGPVTV